MICGRMVSGGFPQQLQLCPNGDKGQREDGGGFEQPFTAGLASRGPKGFQSMCFGTGEHRG